MKVTLRFSSHIESGSNNPGIHMQGLPRATKSLNAANQHRVHFANCSNEQWHTVQRPSLGGWGSVNSGFTLVHKQLTEMPDLITVKKPQLLKKYTYATGLAATQPLNSPSTPEPLASAASYSDSPQIWLFCATAQTLCNDTTCIQLTSIESLLVKTLTQRDERVCSKQELIIGINKNTHSYSGLEMSLSRLQSKFKGVFAERLFRSVRNRGYCLVQDVQAIN